MDPTPKRICPDCETPSSHEIKLILPSLPYPVDGIGYALPESKASFWTSKFPQDGRVAVFLCERCGRITLYGVPKDV